MAQSHPPPAAPDPEQPDSSADQLPFVIDARLAFLVLASLLISAKYGEYWTLSCSGRPCLVQPKYVFVWWNESPHP